MFELLLTSQLLIAQRCGYYSPSVTLTPENTMFGCTVPTEDGRGSVRLREDPFSPSGIKAQPEGPFARPFQYNNGFIQ